MAQSMMFMFTTVQSMMPRLPALFDGGLEEDTDGDGLTDEYEVGRGRYKLIAGSYDWKSAKSDAESRGGHLATITSQEEWEAVRNEVGPLPYLLVRRYG